MKILIVKTSSLGDIVQSFPVLSYLKQHFPDSDISWAVEKPFIDLVEAHPFVDKVYAIESKRWRKSLYSLAIWKDVAGFVKSLRSASFDVVIDLQGNIKSGLVTAFAKGGRKVGFAHPYVAERPSTWSTDDRYLPPENKNIREDYLYLAQKAVNGPPQSLEGNICPLLRISEEQRSENNQILQMLERDSERKLIVFPGAAWKNKQLKETDLASFLGFFEHDYQPAILLAWGTDEERALAERLQSSLKNAQVLKKLPLPQLQHLISMMDLAVAMDSLPLHLSATTSTPTYSFFGPSNAMKYAPQGLRHAFFQGPCPYGMAFERRCPKLRTCQTGSCMHDTEALMLYRRFKQWLNDSLGWEEKL